METKAEKYLDANIASILRNLHKKSYTSSMVIGYVEERLKDVGKMDISKSKLDEILKKYFKNAGKIFSKEATFQGKGEVAQEYRRLSKLKYYSFS